MILNIKNLIEFYDSKEKQNSGLSSPLTGFFGEELVIALVKHYLLNEGYQVTIYNEKPRMRKWLDAWISAKIENSVTLFQVEVKNWSSHSLGGVQLPIDASNEDINLYGLNRLKEHYDVKSKELGRWVKKVDILMANEPKVIYSIKEPLLAFWMAVSANPKSKDLTPSFYIPIKSENFKRLKVFSASIYLRKILPIQSTIELEMPKTLKRIEKFKEIFYY